MTSRGRKPKSAMEVTKVDHLHEARLLRVGTTYAVELWNLATRDFEERLFESEIEGEARAYMRGLVTGAMMVVPR